MEIGNDVGYNFRRVCPNWLNNPFVPIARFPVHVHDSDDSDIFRVVDEDDCVGKVVAEMPARPWIKFSEALGNLRQLPEVIVLSRDKNEHPIRAKLRNNRLPPGEFLIRIRVEGNVHKPAALRARASDSSSGTPFTFPDSSSSIRRSISFFQC